MSIHQSFTRIFKELTGITYQNKPMAFTPEKLHALPTLVFKLDGVDGSPVYVSMPPESYSESLGGDKYAFRVYVNEVSSRSN